MSSVSHGPVSVMDADGDVLASGRTVGGFAARSSEEPARRAGEDRARRPSPVIETGNEDEPSSPQAEQLFRAKRGGSHASSPVERSQAVDDEQEPSRPLATAASEHVVELEIEPSSPQAEQLVRLKRAAAGSQASSPGRASSLGRASEEGEAGGGRQDVTVYNNTSMPIVSDDEPSSPQAQQLFRIKRSAAGSQASSPASRRDENELPSFAADDVEPSSPQAEQLLRIRRAGAGSQSTSPAPSRQAPEDSIEADDTSEPNSPVRQRRKPAVAARGAPEPSRQIAVGRVERQTPQDSENRLFEVQQGRGEIQSRLAEGFGQDELDTLATVWQDSGRDEEISSPVATRLVQAKRVQQSRGLEWGEVQSSPAHSGSSVHEEEARPFLPDDDEPCSPQADSMQRIKAGAARRRQMSPAAEADRQVDQLTQAPSDVHQQCAKSSQSRDFSGELHQAQWQKDASLPAHSFGLSSGGILQNELDRICVEAGDESSPSEPSSPVAQLLLRAKHSKSAHTSPGSGLDTSDGEIGRGTIGSFGYAQSSMRKPASSGSPLGSSTQGITQDELDTLSRSMHAPSGDEPWQAEEPSSPQADQLRRAKVRSRVAGSGGSSGRREESSAELHGVSQHSTFRDGFTQNELDSLSRSSPISIGDGDEVSSPTATQMLRAKRIAQQSLRQAELVVAKFPESGGFEGTGLYEDEHHQEEPSSPCAAQIRRAKKIAQSHSGSSPGSTPHQEDSPPGSGPAFERIPQGGITQAELDAFSRSYSVSEEDSWQGEAPSSPVAQQLRRAKRNAQATPPRVGWTQDSMGLGQEDLDAFSRSNRAPNVAHTGISGQPELTQLPGDRFSGGTDGFGSTSDGQFLFQSVPERGGSEESWFADEGPSSPQAQKHLRAKRMAQQNRGMNQSGGEDPWRIAESQPEPTEAWPYRGASSSVGASSQSQFRTPPSPDQSHGAGLTQAELDSLANHSPLSPTHSTSPPSERGTRRVEPDVGRPASSRSEIPPPPIQYSTGLSQAELNALCQEPRFPSHSGRVGGLGDAEEPVSPQASRMQQIRRAQQYAPVGSAPWA